MVTIPEAGKLRYNEAQIHPTSIKAPKKMLRYYLKYRKIALKYRNIGNIWPKLIKTDVNKLCVLSILDPF